jgi:GDP-D-mannose dehydratase
VGDIVEMVRKHGRVAATVEVDAARLRPLDEAVLVGDNRKLCSETGWQPRLSIDQIVAELLEYWRQRLA